jgi:LmbE family N-acetylglucosaminyl deacetylase
VRPLVAALLISVAWPAAAARIHAVSHPAERILWVGAHPDDETLIAPILGRAASSSMLVFTRGERGDCALPAGCGADLGALRAMEMQKSADFFHSHLTLWNLPDVMDNVIAGWGGDDLVGSIQAVITAERPTLVYTFDPAHGSTCHPAHRAVGVLVMKALARMGSAAPPLVLVETAVAFQRNGFAFSGASPEATAIEAGGDWQYLVHDAEIHVSQFPPEQIDALRRISPEQRRVWLLNGERQTDAHYTLRCD